MSDHDEQFSVITKVQLHGILFKKSFALHSTRPRWSKRFFIVKEGFLLYYSDGEKKVFDKRGYFNIHPKGVIPLGGCFIQASSEFNQEHAVRISSDSFVNGPILLATETRYDQERWIQVLQEAARITWDNSRVGESIIRDLETQGLQLNKEKQSYVEKLHEETIALRDEIDRNEELEKLNNALDEEKRRLELMIQEFREEHQVMKRDYEETISAMKMVQEDKMSLQNTTESLLKSLSELEQEKHSILGTLHQSENSNSKLSQVSQNLQVHLRGIEEETRHLLEEKQDIEERFLENELRAKVLEEEKLIISEQSSQLLSNLNDLLTQQDLAEAELRVEVSARLDAERRLRAAQDSMHHLEGALQADIGTAALRTKILPDVKKLRKFFEDVAEESRIDANMPVIMKNAVYARKTLSKKARSQVLEQSRNEKAKTLGLDLPAGDAPLKRSLSIMITKSSLRPTLTRSKSSRVSSNGSTLGSRPKKGSGDAKASAKGTKTLTSVSEATAQLPATLE